MTSKKAADKAQCIAECVFHHEASKRKEAVQAAIDRYDVGRSYVYRVLGELDPEEKKRMRSFAPFWVWAAKQRFPLD
jgi:hypothetical protein